MICFVAIVFLLLPCPATAQGAATLTRLSLDKQVESAQIYAYFDAVPSYRKRLSGRRLDLVFSDTGPGDGVIPLPADQLLSRCLVQAAGGGRTMVSLFFRFVPQDVKVSLGEAETVIVDVLPGNRFSQSYTRLAAELKGVSLLERNFSSRRPPPDASPYRDDWLSLFTDFEHPAVIEAPLTYHLVPFPLAELIEAEGISRPGAIPAEVFDHVERRAWFDALRSIQRELRRTNDLEAKKRLALTHAELLFRLGNHQLARTQLLSLRNSSEEHPIGRLATYLLALVAAYGNDPYRADFELQRLLDTLAAAHPLVPHLLLTLAETGLAIGDRNRFEELKAFLPFSSDGRLSAEWRLRSADYHHLNGDHRAALADYAEVIDPVSFAAADPFSLHGFCAALYDQKFYLRSRSCYETLAGRLSNDEQVAAARYRAAIAGLKTYSYRDGAIRTLEEIGTAFSGTEAALASRLKLLDIAVGEKGGSIGELSGRYVDIARQSLSRRIRAEARFKAALVHHLRGDDRGCIGELMALLDSIRSGPFVPFAEALLIDLLPAELERLVQEFDYIGAISLARQNRRLFENGWLDLSLLSGIGRAYEMLGLYRESLALLLFLRERLSVDRQDDVHLALTRVAHKKGDRRLVEDFSSRYFLRFPRGKHYLDVLYYRIDSLYADGHVRRALAMMPEPLPRRSEYQFLSASLYFSSGDYDTVAATLLPLYESGSELTDRHLFELAESLYQLDREDEAAAVLNRLEERQEFSGYVRYRLAQIARQRGDEDKAADYLASISTSTADPVWRKLSRYAMAAGQIEPVPSPPPP